VASAERGDQFPMQGRLWELVEFAMRTAIGIVASFAMRGALFRRIPLLLDYSLTLPMA
jgi:hypothetical protein